MGQAYIVDALRTPVGRRGRALAGVHPLDLAALPLRALMERAELDPAAVDEVILGCIDQLGPQSMDVARNAWLAAGLPESVPGTTLERQCGSGQQAVSSAARAVASGFADLVVAGGTQSMSAIPLSSSNRAAAELGFPDPFTGSRGWAARYGGTEISQFRGAELIARRWGLGRDELEDFAARSHDRALAALQAGRFEREIVPVALAEDGGVAEGTAGDGTAATGAGEAAGVVGQDEGPRPVDRERMASLPPIVPGGLHTAATASQVSDGAAALLIASEDAVRVHGLTPRARIHHVSARGDDPVAMLTAPIAATRHALERTGMGIEDMDLIEINEAFAAVVLAWERELRPDGERVNVNGGAIALGHPIGATGARLLVSLLHELERTGGRWGLQTMCEGGGQADVTVIERL